MKYLIFLFLMTNAQAMTLEQAKAKIAELVPKQNKTRQDIADLKTAIGIVSGSFAIH